MLKKWALKNKILIYMIGKFYQLCLLKKITVNKT